MICESARHSSIGLLVAGTGTVAAEFLGLHAARIRNEQSFVVLDKERFQLTLGVFVVVLLVIGNDGLGNSLTHGQNLSRRTGAGDTHADVKISEVSGAEQKNRLPNLHPEGSGLEDLNGLSVNVDKAFAGSASGNGGRVLLAAESLNLLNLVLRHLFLRLFSSLKT